ncbi:hypothetical protein ACEQ8H_005565 [Pleosporales sp. CAS-2024a]
MSPDFLLSTSMSRESRRQSPRPVMMEHLVEDVRLLVLEHLLHPSDLRALCHVSRSWNRVATPNLYSHVTLDISSSHGQLAQFEACLSSNQRALQHLTFTRSLLLYEVKSQVDKLGSAELPPSLEDMEPRYRFYMVISELTHVRYSAHLPLDASCLDYLNRYQSSITDIHISNCDPLLLLARPRRSITAYFGMNANAHTFVAFAKSLCTLDALTISLPGGWLGYDYHYWDDVVDPLEGHKISAGSLTIIGYLPPGLGGKLDQMFNWSMLTSLSLLEGDLCLFQDVLAARRSILGLCNLLYFQCYTDDCIFERYIIMLHDFFKQNNRLKHVLLSISGLARLRLDISEQLQLSESNMEESFIFWPLRHQLETLVWHDPIRIPPLGHFGIQREPIGAKALQCLCDNFPQLQELGIMAPPWLRSDGKMEYDPIKDLFRYLEPLVHLKKLTMLHLYHENMVSEAEEESQIYLQPDLTCFDIQNFATSLFQLMHDKCPHFHVLAWGVYSDVCSEAGYFEKLYPCESAEHASNSIPELFFLKKLDLGKDGGKSITATFTTRSRLRADFPDLVLPACDPGFLEFDRYAFGC